MATRWTMPNELFATEEKLSDAERKKLGGLPSWPPKADATPMSSRSLAECRVLRRGDPGRTLGHGGDTPVSVFLAGGRELRWDEQDDLQTITRLRGPLIRAGLRPRNLSPHAVGLVAWAITRLAILRADATDKDEARSWARPICGSAQSRRVQER